LFKQNRNPSNELTRPVTICACADVAGDLFVIVYSVDSRESFDEARRLQDQMIVVHTLPVFTARGHGQSLRVPNPHYPVLCLRTTPVTARKQE